MTKHIDFAYRLGKGISSWGIAYWGGDEWSHVDVVNSDTGLWWGARSDAVGGQPPGFWPRPGDYETKIKRLMVLRLSVTDRQYAAFWSIAEGIKGDPYNKKGIYGFALDNNWSQRGAYFCSQASAMLKLKAGVMHQPHRRLSKITPGDDALAVSVLGGVEVAPPSWYHGRQ